MESIFDRILITGEELRVSLEKDPEHPNITALRKLHHYCSKKLFEAESKYDRFLCFFICSLIDDIFLNLGGDTPYDQELHSTRLSLFNKISEVFLNIGKISSDKEGLLDIIENLSDLINNYTERVNFLNKSRIF